MSKHTPGPWNAKEEWLYKGKHHTAGNGPEVLGICIVRRHSDADGRCEVAEANARLIAAAPDLLEACKIAAHHMSCIAIGGSVEAILRAAIAKAEGRDA